MTLIDSKVSTTDGDVRGLRGKRARRGTISWRGIPFAAPPVAGRRFQAPAPTNPWPGVRDCFAFGKAAIQDKRFAATGPGRYHPLGEDCLTLNVFSAETTSSTPRPVMVFIHGGAYILGTTATPLYDGTFLARSQDVIVVTAQYRFGPFGYLDFTQYSTDERTFDSNLGLRDQVAALTWVQRNIAAFGGDPDNVTVFGESAGGSAVLSLLSAPSAKGLFTKAIAESPAPALVIGKRSADIFADEFLRILQDPDRRGTAERTDEPIPADTAAALLDSASARELHVAGRRLMSFARHSSVGEPVPFGPVVDGSYLPKSSLQTAADGETHPVPLIIGTNKHEGQLFTKLWSVLPSAERALIAVEDEEIRTEIASLYTGGPRDEVKLTADATFWAPTAAFAADHSAVAPTYLYRYDYATKLLRASGFGATHATELFSVFGAYRTPLAAGLAVGDWRSTARITRTVQQRWGEFARKGVPGFGWPVYNTEDRKVLILDDPERIADDPDGSRRSAWARAHAAAAASTN